MSYSFKMRVLFLFFIVCFSIVSAKYLPENPSNSPGLWQNDKIDSNKKSDDLERNDDNNSKSIDTDNNLKNIVDEVINKRLEKLEKKHKKEVDKLNKELEKLGQKIQKVQSKLNENDDDDSSDGDDSSDTSEDHLSERKEMQNLSERQEHIKEQLEYKNRELAEEKQKLENQRHELFKKIEKQPEELRKSDDQESKKQVSENKQDKNIDDSLEKEIDKRLRKYEVNIQKQQRDERRKQAQERSSPSTNNVNDSNLPTVIPKNIPSVTNDNVAGNNKSSTTSVQSSYDVNTISNNGSTAVPSGSDSLINNVSSTVYIEPTLIPDGRAPSSHAVTAGNNMSATIPASATINDNTATNNIATIVSGSIVQPNNNNVVDALLGNNMPATDSAITEGATKDLSPNTIGPTASTLPVANEAVIVNSVNSVNSVLAANASVSGDGVSSANDVVPTSDRVPMIDATSSNNATVSVHDVSPSNVIAVDTISEGSPAFPNGILANNVPTTDLGLVDGASISNYINTTVDNKPAVDANSSTGNSALSIDAGDTSLSPNNFDTTTTNVATVIFSNESTTDTVVPAVGVLPPNEVVIAVDNMPVFDGTTPAESATSPNDVDTMVNKKQTSTAPSNDAVVTEGISATDNIVPANAASLLNDAGVAEDNAPSADATVIDTLSNDTSATIKPEWPVSASGVSSPSDSISSPVNASINNKTTSNDTDGSTAISNDANDALTPNVTDTSVTNPATNNSAVILNNTSLPKSTNVLTENSDSTSTIPIASSILTTPSPNIDASGVMSTESNVFGTDTLPAETVAPETASSGTSNLTANNFTAPSSVVSTETEQPNSGPLLDSTARTVTTSNPEITTVAALDKTTVIQSISETSNNEVLSTDTSNDILNKSSVSVGELSTVAPITDYVPTSITETVQVITVETAPINTSNTSVSDATSNDGNILVNDIAAESTGFPKEPEPASVLAGENLVPIPQETGATIVEINTQ